MPYPCPPLDPALVKWLDKVYPERSPRRGTSVEDIWFDSGAREVVRNLIIELERQQAINVPPETPQDTSSRAATDSAAAARGRPQSTGPQRGL